MSADRKFDFHYAVENTFIILAPSGQLETFGNTIVNYSLVSESMDEVGVCRIRTGRMQLLKPQIIAPSDYSKMLLEGFGEEAQRYVEWLEKHNDDIHILRYGYTLKQEAFSEETVTGDFREVLERVKKDVEEKKDPYRAVVAGVDSPWDVCLVKLFWVMVRQSAKKNIMDMAKKHMFDKRAAISPEVHEEIERAFAAAGKDPSLVKDLGALLQRHKVFPMYEDRFFSLIGH